MVGGGRCRWGVGVGGAEGVCRRGGGWVGWGGRKARHNGNCPRHPSLPVSHQHMSLPSCPNSSHFPSSSVLSAKREKYVTHVVIKHMSHVQVHQVRQEGR